MDLGCGSDGLERYGRRHNNPIFTIKGFSLSLASVALRNIEALPSTEVFIQFKSFFLCRSVYLSLNVHFAHFDFLLDALYLSKRVFGLSGYLGHGPCSHKFSAGGSGLVRQTVRFEPVMMGYLGCHLRSSSRLSCDFVIR